MSKKQKNDKSKIIIVLIICIALLLIGGLGVGIYMMERSDGDTAKKQEDISDGTQDGEDTLQTEQKGKFVLDDSLYYGDVAEENIRKEGESVLEYADNQLLITAEKGTTKEQVESLLASYQAKIVGYIEVTNTYQIQFPKGYSKKELEQIGEELEQNQQVSDYMINAVFDTDISAVYPNDKKWKNKWGDTYPKGNNWGMEAIHAPEAWEYKDRLSTVNVGVWDNTFAEHKDLHYEDIWQNISVKDLKARDKESNENHGNHVSGTIGAEFDNGVGVCGVSPAVDLYATSFAAGESKYNSSSMALMAGMTYLINHEKCKVINMSVGWEELIISASENNQDTISYIDEQAQNIGNYLQKLLDMGNDFVICKAAGNENKKEGHPVYAYDLISAITNSDIRDRTIVVGAAKNLGNGNYQIANFSNCGDRVDVVAPGVGIYSTGFSNNYKEMRGTSMATPHVSGIAALCFGVNQSLSGAQVKRIIKDTAQGTIRYADNSKASYAELKDYAYPMADAQRAVERAAQTEGDYQGNPKQVDTILDTSEAERDVVLVLDHSGSMGGQPLDETKKAATNFADTVLEQDTRAAVVAYDDEASLYCGLTRDNSLLDMNISTIDEGGSTNMYAGLEMADEILKQSSAKKKIIVLMSDGLPNMGVSYGMDYFSPLIDYAETLKNQGYYIYTLGFFTDVIGTDLSNAQQLMEGIANPGLHYEVTSADDLVFFFDDIAGQINGTEYVYIRIACPVDVTVTSGDETLSTIPGEDGEVYTRTSFGTLTLDSLTEEEMDSDSSEASVQDIYNDDIYDENGNFDIDQFEENLQEYEKDWMSGQAKVLRLKADQDYDVDIEGYDNGTMDYTVSYQNENGEYDDVRTFTDIPVTSSMKATSNTGKSDASYLEVDEDGDGNTDKKYKTEKNGTMEEVKEGDEEEKDHTVLYICIGVAVVVVMILVIVIIVIVNQSGKKKKEKEKIQKKEIKTSYDVISGAVVGVFGKYGGQVYPIHSNTPCIVGRKSSCNIQIVHKQVSRVHCAIQLLPDGNYQVTDYSENGTFYNNQRLPKNQPCTVSKGALLAIGDADNILELK